MLVGVDPIDIDEHDAVINEKPTAPHGTLQRLAINKKKGSASALPIGPC